MKVTHTYVMLALFLVLALPLLAEPQGLYFGGSVGQSFVKTEVTDIQDVDFKLDENDFAFKFLAGVRMGAILAFEGGYKHLGNVRNKMDEYTFESKIVPIRTPARNLKAKSFSSSLKSTSWISVTSVFTKLWPTAPPK